MLEKYKYTGKHRKNNESLVPVSEVLEQVPNYSEVDTVPIDTRPLTPAEIIEQTDAPNVAFQEVIAAKDSSPEQSIKNIDLAVKHFGAEEFSSEERQALAEIIVEKSNDIIHKSNPDFTDPYTLGFAIDTLHALEVNTNGVEKPILDSIITKANTLTEVRTVDEDTNKTTVTVRINPEEATAITQSVREFRHLPDGHRQQLMDLMANRLRRVTADHIRGKQRIGATAIKQDATSALLVDSGQKAA